MEPVQREILAIQNHRIFTTKLVDSRKDLWQDGKLYLYL